MTGKLLPGERELLATVVANLVDDVPKLVYADWLEEQGDARRSRFLRTYVEAAKSMDPKAFPGAKGLSEEWLELIGFRLVEQVAAEGVPELMDRVWRLARPALRMKKGAADGRKIASGASKIGGHPDLPPDFRWPIGDDCRAIFNDATGGEQQLAGFLTQINLAEIADTFAAKDLPRTGMLSFFGFQDIENGVIGAKAEFVADVSNLVRTEPPGPLTEGNDVIPPQRVTFEETLDLPATWGLWTDDLMPDPEGEYDIYENVRSLNFENILGYARQTTGMDPTPSKQSRHLILLENSVGCRLHIQIHQDDLAALNFNKITLNWVDSP